MRQLLILRHAKSSWDDAALPDRDRPLNARGRRTAAIMRQAMHDLHLAPDVVLVSTARRTLETLEALEPWDDAPLVDPMDSLYLANAVQLMAALHEVAETVRSVLLIGHNPGLHDLAVGLAGPRAIAAGGVTERRLAASFPTAALAEFVIAGWFAS
jgi:phosphohistidine phosphatase